MYTKKLMLFLLFPLLITFFGLSYSAEASGQENIHFNSTSPKENQIITQNDNTLNLDIVGIKSTFQIKQVTATIDKQTTSLQFSNGNYFAKIPLSTLKEGAKKVKITATDVYGNSKSISTNFQYIKQPIHITSPISHNFYNKTDITIKATAKNFAGSKAKFFVTVDGKTIATGTKNSINQKVDLSNYNGKAITLKFTIKNTSTGLRYTESHKIYVEDSPVISSLAKVEGEILEFKEGKLLYKTKKNEIWLKDTSNNTNNLVYKNSTNDFTKGYIADSAIVFSTASDPYYELNLYEYKDGVLQKIGIAPDKKLSTAGDVLIWNGTLEGDQIQTANIYLRQLDTGKTTLLSGSSLWWNDVFVNSTGEAFYSTSNGTSKYSSGTISEVPVTGSITGAEGDLLLVNRGNLEHDETFVKWPGGETKLANYWDTTAEFYPNYSREVLLIKNGRIAFEKYKNEKFQIHIWENGSEKQISFLGDSTRIGAFADNGDLLTKNSYLLKNESEYTTKPIKLFTLPMKTYWEGTQAYGTFGGHLVKIKTDHTPVTKIKMSQKAVSLLEKKTKQLHAVVTPTNATFTKVIWSSSNAKVATVDAKGKVTGKLKGKATITARSIDGSITSTTAVTVIDVTPPSAPTINNVTSKAKKITGKAEAGSTVKIYIKGKYMGSTKASVNKNFSFTIKPQKTGSVIKAIAVDSSKNKSKAKSIKVKNKVTHTRKTILSRMVFHVLVHFINKRKYLGNRLI